MSNRRHSNDNSKLSFDNNSKKNRSRDGNQSNKIEKPSNTIYIINIILKSIIILLIIYTVWMNNKILNTTITADSTKK